MKDSTKHIIKLSIEGGYISPTGDIRDSLLNPLFWKALDKRLGWGDIKKNSRNVSWLENWHLFTDHLASGFETYFQRGSNTHWTNNQEGDNI